MRGKEIVSLGVFWGNVSERYLKVSRIYLDHHRVWNFFFLYFCHVAGVGEFEFCSACVAVALVAASRRLDIFVVAEFLKAIVTVSLIVIFLGWSTCAVFHLTNDRLDREEYRCRLHVEGVEDRDS